MSRYTRKEFEDASISPDEKCDRIISDECGGETLYMVCAYHEGWIDGYDRGARENM